MVSDSSKYDNRTRLSTIPILEHNRLYKHNRLVPRPIYVTGYSKTDHNFTFGQLLLLAQLIATLMHYPCTVALLG